MLGPFIGCSVRLGLSFKLGIEIGQSTVHEQMRSSPGSRKGSLSPERPVAQVNAPGPDET
jgi:hypothetical protein